MRIGFTLAVFSCVFGFHALGASPFTFEKGKPVTAEFDDGSSAILMLERRPPLTITMPFQVTENTCADGVEIVCEFSSSVMLDFLGMRWERPLAKAGRQMNARDISSGRYISLQAFNIFGLVERGAVPLTTSAMPADKIVCKDYSWLPGSVVSPAPDKVRVSRWDAEFMFNNPETGFAENRTVGLAQSLYLEKNAAGDLEIVGAKKFLGQSFAFFFGDIWALVMPLPDGEFCQISLKAELGNVLTEIINYFSTPGTAAPYIWGSDEYSTTAQPFFIQEFQTHADKYEYR